MDDVKFIDVSGDEEKEAKGIKCSNVNDPEGFDC